MVTYELPVLVLVGLGLMKQEDIVTLPSLDFSICESMVQNSANNIRYGKDNYDVPNIIYPALFPMNLAPGSDTAIFHECEGGPSLNNRRPVIPTGGVLGGGSSINFLM